MPKSMDKVAGCQLSHRIPDAAAKIPRTGTERVEGAPQQAEGPAKRGHSFLHGCQGTGADDRAQGYLGIHCTGKEPGLWDGAPVLHPRGVRRQSQWGHPCCGEGLGAVDGLAWLGHLLQTLIIPHWDFSLQSCGMCGTQLWVTPTGTLASDQPECREGCGPAPQHTSWQCSALCQLSPKQIFGL